MKEVVVGGSSERQSRPPIPVLERDSRPQSFTQPVALWGDDEQTTVTRWEARDQLYLIVPKFPHPAVSR